MSNSIVVEKQNQRRTYSTEWLKSFKGFEHYSEKEAEEVIRNLEDVATIVCTHLINTS
jgi:hypothetical protein